MVTRNRKIQIEVDGQKLTVTQISKNSVSISRVVGRDRKKKIDIVSSRLFTPAEPAVIDVLRRMKALAAQLTKRCTCDYRYGFSDHAESCQSTHVAECPARSYDDD